MSVVRFSREFVTEMFELSEAVLSIVAFIGLSGAFFMGVFGLVYLPLKFLGRLSGGNWDAAASAVAAGAVAVFLVVILIGLMG